VARTAMAVGLVVRTAAVAAVAWVPRARAPTGRGQEGLALGGWALVGQVGRLRMSRRAAVLGSAVGLGTAGRVDLARVRPESLAAVDLGRVGPETVAARALALAVLRGRAGLETTGSWAVAVLRGRVTREPGTQVPVMQGPPVLERMVSVVPVCVARSLVGRRVRE
jgi:hypothetical protein